MITAAVLMAIIVFLWPLTVLFKTVLFDQNLINSLQELFSTQLFVNAVKNTVFLTTVSLLFQVSIGLSIGRLIGSDRRYIFLVPILLIPVVLPPSVSALMWRLLLDPVSGPIAEWIGAATGAEFDWSSNSLSALGVILLVDAWQWTPLMILLFAISAWSIDRRTLAAYNFDGVMPQKAMYTALFFEKSALIAFIIAFRLIESLKLFDPVYVLTRGGPGSATEVMSIYIYRYAFVFFDNATAFSASMVLLLLSIGASALFMFLFKMGRK